LTHKPDYIILLYIHVYFRPFLNDFSSHLLIIIFSKYCVGGKGLCFLLQVCCFFDL